MCPDATSAGGTRTQRFATFFGSIRTDRQVIGLAIAGLTYMVMLGGLRPFLFWANRDWYGGLRLRLDWSVVAQGGGALIGALVSALFAQRLLRHMSAYTLCMVGGILEGAGHLLLLLAQTSAQAMVILALAGIPEIVSTAAWFTAFQTRLTVAQQGLFFTFLAPMWDLCFALGITSAALHAEGLVSLSGYWMLVSLTSTLPLFPLLLQAGGRRPA